jgi:hypothetical protein
MFEETTKKTRRLAIAVGISAAVAGLDATAPGPARAQGCGADSAPSLVRGLNAPAGAPAADGDLAFYANPRSQFGAFDPAGQSVPGWRVTVNGGPPPGPDDALPAGSYEVVATPDADCGATGPRRARVTVDDTAPELTWRLADIGSMTDQLPDLGREKRFRWWWVQPERRRLVWADGRTAWASLRQKVGVEVDAASGASHLYVWAPDKSPFEATGDQPAPDKETVVIIEATDASSGVGGLRLRLVEKVSKASTADEDAEYVLLAEATDRVGNSTEIELPFFAEQAKGPRKGPF